MISVSSTGSLHNSFAQKGVSSAELEEADLMAVDGLNSDFISSSQWFNCPSLLHGLAWIELDGVHGIHSGSAAGLLVYPICVPMVLQVPSFNLTCSCSICSLRSVHIYFNLTKIIGPFNIFSFCF